MVRDICRPILRFLYQASPHTISTHNIYLNAIRLASSQENPRQLGIPIIWAQVPFLRLLIIRHDYIDLVPISILAHYCHEVQAAAQCAQAYEPNANAVTCVIERLGVLCREGISCNYPTDVA